jgi:formyl-CoA transferase
MRVGIPITDIVTGLYAALGIFVALIERQTSNEGQWVQGSLLESQMFMLDLQAARYLVDGIVGKQVGNEHPTGVPTNAYKTKDGYVNIAPVPSMWPRLCKAIGREDLAEHPDYCTREARRPRRKEINSLIQSITETMDSATLIEKLQGADVPCGPIYNIEQAFNDPQAKHLGLGQTVTDTTGKDITLPRQPIRLSRTPSKLTTRTPEFAEHTDEVLAEFGFTDAEIKGYRQTGAVE